MEIEKYCQTCCARLVRKKGEPLSRWKKRTHCDRDCASNDAKEIKRRRGTKGGKFFIPRKDVTRTD